MCASYIYPGKSVGRQLIYNQEDYFSVKSKQNVDEKYMAYIAIYTKYQVINKKLSVKVVLCKISITKIVLIIGSVIVLIIGSIIQNIANYNNGRQIK